MSEDNRTMISEPSEESMAALRAIDALILASAGRRRTDDEERELIRLRRLL